MGMGVSVEAPTCALPTSRVKGEGASLYQYLPPHPSAGELGTQLLEGTGEALPQHQAPLQTNLWLQQLQRH